LKFVESFKDIKNAQLVGIVSKNINRLKVFKEKFKINKKTDKRSRLFNKELGGGFILNLSSYPAPLSLLIVSLVLNINLGENNYIWK
tara:strand:- start:365 stop:625 length:261 start_codon:yes stop_codon:yes gene_type:complete